MCVTIAVPKVTLQENVRNLKIQIASDAEVRVITPEIVLKKDKIKEIVTNVENLVILQRSAPINQQNNF